MQRKLPAYPLFVKDPYFSFWAKTEQTGKESVIFWTGEEKGVYGVARVNGRPYTFLGKIEGVQPAELTHISLTAFATECTFQAGDAQLSVRFVSALPPDDLTMLSCPACYLTYEISGADNAEVFLAMRQDVCYSPESAGEVRGGTVACNGFTAAFFGLKTQAPFTHNEDVCCADWGYFYLSGQHAAYTTAEAFARYVLSGETGENEVVNAPEKYILASARGNSGMLCVAHDDVASVRYFGKVLRGYFMQENTALDALRYTYEQRDAIENAEKKYNERLQKAAKMYGEAYRNVLAASLRQSVGAHKLVRSDKGEVLFLSKECNSNGCMATVDVTYPSAPLYLLYNPELLRGMLRPVFAFAKMPAWPYDFAPHDVGTYPLACGQVYGLHMHRNKLCGDATESGRRQTRPDIYGLPADAQLYALDGQMPVEESANMLILTAALYKADDDLSLFKQNKKQLRDWVGYLVRLGLYPENQLCTDDFAGHLQNNVNLAIKATVGIASYAMLCGAAGMTAAQKKYREIAESYAQKIAALSEGRDCLPLTWEGGDTFGLKYNLAFDKLLGLGLFPSALCEKEADAYLRRANEYGVPLDNRATYTKSDWLLWAAVLTDDTKKRCAFIELLDRYLQNTPTRVPFGDWYDTVSADSISFRNRTVQGGCFILLMQP